MTMKTIGVFKSISAAALLLAAATLSGPAALAAGESEANGDVARGEIAYEANCSSCHANPGRLMRRVPGADDAEKAARLEAFLPDHYAEDPQERAEIIAYMLSL
jgi:mono/diheme cytochrome c family protein